MYHPTDEISAQFAQCNPLAMPQAVVYPTGAYAQMEHPSASFGPVKYCQSTVGTTSSTQPPETEAHSSPQSHMLNVGVPQMAANGCLQIPTNPGGPRIEMNVSVPDERIGAIIGRGGEIITQLQTLVGVKIIISGRNEFEPGTRNRRVTIIGPPEAVQIAHMLICMKVRTCKNNSTKIPVPFRSVPWLFHLLSAVCTIGVFQLGGWEAPLGHLPVQMVNATTKFHVQKRTHLSVEVLVCFSKKDL